MFVALAVVAPFGLVSRDVDAGKRTADAQFLVTSSTRLSDFWCQSEWKLYDPVEVSYLRVGGLDVTVDRCTSPISGVTVRASFPYGLVLENFPAGFRGPATVLTCDFEVLHYECPPTLEELHEDQYVHEARGPDGSQIELPSLCASHLDCDKWPCLGSEGPYAADVCGDPNGDGNITATDALIALLAAVSDQDCPLTQCDSDRSGSVQATDALRILQAGLQLPPLTDLLLCPGPCAPASATTIAR